MSSLESALVRAATRQRVYGRGGRPVRRLEEGATRSWAERELTRMVNYNRLSKSDVLVTGFRQNRDNKVLPHRQVTEPKM